MKKISLGGFSFLFFFKRTNKISTIGGGIISIIGILLVGIYLMMLLVNCFLADTYTAIIS